MKKVSIMIPAFNEEECIPILFEKVKEIIDSQPSYSWEVMFVNDGSTDNTVDIFENLRLKDKRINYIDLSRNYGKEVAMLAGIDYVTGDCMVIMDADLQHPPTLIPEMLKYWEEGYHDVYACRDYRQEETALKRWTSRTYYKLLQKLSGIPIQINTGDFRLLDRCCINALRQLRETQRYSKGFYSWIGFKKKKVLFEANKRFAGDTKWNTWRLIGLAIEGLTSFTIAPLRLSSIIGTVISLCSFIYFLFVIIRALAIGDPVPGYPSLMSVILFMGGVQLLSIGIIGEYLGRIFYETKNRPAYFVQSFNGEKSVK